MQRSAAFSACRAVALRIEDVGLCESMLVRLDDGVQGCARVVDF